VDAAVIENGRPFPVPALLSSPPPPPPPHLPPHPPPPSFPGLSTSPILSQQLHSLQPPSTTTIIKMRSFATFAVLSSAAGLAAAGVERRWAYPESFLAARQDADPEPGTPRYACHENCGKSHLYLHAPCCAETDSPQASPSPSAVRPRTTAPTPSGTRGTARASSAPTPSASGSTTAAPSPSTPASAA
jgi:hypothetical protein